MKGAIQVFRFKVDLKNFVAVWNGEVAAVKMGVTRAVDRATARLQQKLRAQTLAAGLGQGNANAWRTRRYPEDRDSLNAAGLVYSKSPAVIDGFNKGSLITHHGSRYLAIPTNFNRKQGKRRAIAENKGKRNYWLNVRVKPEEMVESRQSFIIKSKKKAGVLLWCLQVNEARGRYGRNKQGKRRAFAGGLVEVGTAHGSRRGRGRTGTQQQKVGAILASGFVPMFSLTPAVKLEKRLDLDRLAGEAAADVAAQITAELG